MYTKHLLIITTVALAVGALGCAKKDKPAEQAAATATEALVESGEAGEVDQAEARMESAPDGTGTGMVMFEKTAEGVRVTAHLVGAPPGTHGLHIHEIGDCSAEDFTSAGGHFNPTDAPHGGPNDPDRHAGDLGNIVVGDDGSAHLELVSNMISLGDGEDSVLGRGVILHAKADDLVSQPTGAAGARLACGVVVPRQSA